MNYLFLNLEVNFDNKTDYTPFKSRDNYTYKPPRKLFTQKITHFF